MSTVHISQLTYFETIFHTGLQLQFTQATLSEYYFCRNVIKNNRKREIILKITPILTRLLTKYGSLLLLQILTHSVSLSLPGLAERHGRLFG